MCQKNRTLEKKTKHVYLWHLCCRAERCRRGSLGDKLPAAQTDDVVHVLHVRVGRVKQALEPEFLPRLRIGV